MSDHQRRIAEIEARLNAAYPNGGGFSQGALNAFSRKAAGDIEWLCAELRKAREENAARESWADDQLAAATLAELHARRAILQRERDTLAVQVDRLEHAIATIEALGPRTPAEANVTPSTPNLSSQGTEKQ